MATQVIRGDSYFPLYTLTFTNEGGEPLNLTDSVVRTTYKTEVTDPNTDTTDATAVIKHYVVIDGAGDMTDNEGLYMTGAATDGIIIETLTKEETLALELNTTYISDVEFTTEEGVFVTTFMYDSDPLTAIDGVTNRTVD